MADMPTSFWGGWVTVLTVVSLSGLVWLLFSIYFGSGKVEEQEHVVWDENLNEGTHAPPLWWFWLIFAAMIFSVIYLILYPGLGTFAGALKWSQGHRLDQSYEQYQQDYEAIRRSMLAMPMQELQQDEFVMSSARGLFDRNCAGCHGPDGRGMANRFPDLFDADWQWGGSAAQIEQTIRQGQRANMPGWAITLDAQRIGLVIAYLHTLGGEGGAANETGRQTYNQFCTGCHGADGRGNPAIGSPNLTDSVWLYGNSDEELTATIMNGRSGVMPAFAQRLDETQIRLLVAWLTRPPPGSGKASKLINSRSYP
jgi:cytochrome c oxidase cbb3-type subunit 3